MGELSFRSDEVNVGLVAELDAFFAAPLDTPKSLRFGTPTGSTAGGGVAALRSFKLSTPFLSMNDVKIWTQRVHIQELTLASSALAYQHTCFPMAMQHWLLRLPPRKNA